MMKRNMMLASMMALALGLAACKEEQTTSTETTEVSETTEGTVIETKTKSETIVDEHGNATSTEETKTTVDPEGALNKETVEETKTEEKH